MSLDHDNEFVKSQSITKDEFLGGRLTLNQPKTGFRAGIDSVLLGASVAANSRTLLDLGAGVGTAACVALAHNEALFALMVENNNEMRSLCAQNLTENGFAGRAETMDLDVIASGKIRTAAGLKTDHFTSIITNPPFFDSHTGTKAPKADKASARHMSEGTLDNWVRTAAASAAPNGEVIFIYRADGLSQLLSAFAQRFGNVTLLPIAPRPDTDATRLLIRGIKGSRKPMALRPPLVLHGATGHAFLPEINSIFRGSAVLHW